MDKRPSPALQGFGRERKLIDRMKRYFVKERKVAEQSIARLDQLTGEV